MPKPYIFAVCPPPSSLPTLSVWWHLLVLPKCHLEPAFPHGLSFFFSGIAACCDVLCPPSCIRCRPRHCEQEYRERVNLTLGSALHVDVRVSSVPTNTSLSSIYMMGFYLMFVDNYLLLYRNALCLFTKYVCAWYTYEIIMYTLRISKNNRRNWFVT